MFIFEYKKEICSNFTFYNENNVKSILLINFLILLLIIFPVYMNKNYRERKENMYGYFMHIYIFLY